MAGEAWHPGSKPRNVNTHPGKAALQGSLPKHSRNSATRTCGWQELLSLNTNLGSRHLQGHVRGPPPPSLCSPRAHGDRGTARGTLVIWMGERRGFWHGQGVLARPQSGHVLGSL